MAEPGWIDVAGGKLTTYRLMAEQTVDRVVQHIGKDAWPCRTAVEPLLAKDALRGSGTIPPEVTREQVEHYCRNEWAVHLDDVMIRRSSGGHYRKDAASTARAVAGWMARIGQWDQRRTDAEIQRYQAALTYPHPKGRRSPPIMQR